MGSDQEQHCFWFSNQFTIEMHVLEKCYLTRIFWFSAVRGGENPAFYRLFTSNLVYAIPSLTVSRISGMPFWAHIV